MRIPQGTRGDALIPARLFHRYPFVLVDRLDAAERDASVATRLISVDDALFEGAAGATWSQVLLVEAMAQTAALFAEEEGRTSSGMIVGLKRITFGRPPGPGDRLSITARMAQRFADLLRIEARAVESGEEIAAGEILISLAGGAEG